MSDSSYQLCPAERHFAPKAIYLQRDLDRVTGVMQSTTLAEEMRRIEGGERLHRATVAYEISNMEMSDGFLFRGGWKDRLLRTPPPEKRKKEVIAHGTLAGTYFGSLYFAHWMTDDLSLHLAAETTGDSVVPERVPYYHEDGYKQLLGLEPRKVARARFEKLTFLDDTGQNSFKRQRYQKMRDRLSANLGGRTNRRIFLHRGASGVSRLLKNESEIQEKLQELGFLVVDPAKLSAAELVRQTAGAEIVIGVEGSQIAHALYSIAENGVLCALQPPYRFNNLFKDYADCLGLHYAFLTGKPVEGGFFIEVDEICALVERITSIIVK